MIAAAHHIGFRSIDIPLYLFDIKTGQFRFSSFRLKSSTGVCEYTATMQSNVNACNMDDRRIYIYIYIYRIAYLFADFRKVINQFVIIATILVYGCTADCS